MLEKAYKNSLSALGAYKDDKLVGITCAVGDGVTIMFIQDIVYYLNISANAILVGKTR